jgi:hypothetical protein
MMQIFPQDTARTWYCKINAVYPSFYPQNFIKIELFCIFAVETGKSLHHII